MEKIFIGSVSFTPKIRTVEQNEKVIKLRNKESEMLTFFCNSYPASLSREQIEKSIWIESYVTDNTLTQAISNLRTAINDRNHELIITLPKKGYCLAIEPKFIFSESKFFSDEPKNIVSNTRENSKFDRFSVVTWLGGIIFFLFFFYLSFSFFFNKYQVTIVHVNSKKLPIKINLNKDLDANFLLAHDKHPFLLLKKNSDDSYIACEPYKGGLRCLKK